VGDGGRKKRRRKRVAAVEDGETIPREDR